MIKNESDGLILPKNNQETSLPVWIVCLFISVIFIGGSLSSNSEIWQHLANGRVIAEQGFPSTQDRLSFTASEPWVNHSWLWDWFSYQMVKFSNPSVLSIFQTGLFIILWLRIATFRNLGTLKNFALTFYLLIISFGMIVFGYHNQISPIFISCLFSVELIRILYNQTDAKTLDRKMAIRLVLLQWLWVQIDAMYWLGFLLIGIRAVFQVLPAPIASTSSNDSKKNAPQTSTPRADSRSFPFWQIGLGMVFICLLNPFHIQIFQLPVEFQRQTFSEVFQKESFMQAFFQRGYDLSFWQRDHFISLPTIAFWLLMMGCLGSFLVAGPKDIGTRLGIALLFLALGLFRVRFLPLFAVGLSLVSMWNLSLYLLRKAERKQIASSKVNTSPKGTQKMVSAETTELPPSKKRKIFRQPLFYGTTHFILSFGLMLLSWTGWLYGDRYGPRSWSLDVDPGMQKLARLLKQQRQENHLVLASESSTETQILTLSPVLGNYLGWLDPDSKIFLDARLTPFRKVASDFSALRRFISQPDPSAYPKFLELLRKYHIHQMVFYSIETDQLIYTMRNLLNHPDEWQLLGLAGKSSLWRWYDAQPKTPSGIDLPSEKNSLNRTAFLHPTAEDLPPREGQSRLAKPWFFLDAIDRISLPPSFDADEARFWLYHFPFEKSRKPQNLGGFILEPAQIAQIIGQSAAGVDPLTSAFLTGFSFQRIYLTLIEKNELKEDFLIFLINYLLRIKGTIVARQDDRSPTDLYLAIRKARRALAENPDDPITYLILGDAYHSLMKNTSERDIYKRFPNLSVVRHGQAISCYQLALRLDPDNYHAHDKLYQLFSEKRFLDNASYHLGRMIAIRERRLGTNLIEIDRNRKELEVMGNYLKMHQQEIDKIREDLEQKLPNVKFSDKTRIYRERGLSQMALDMLLQSDIAAMGKDGAREELNLFFEMGRFYEVKEREMIDEDKKTYFDSLTFSFYKLQMALGEGNYQEAFTQITEMEKALRTGSISPDSSNSSINAEGLISVNVASVIGLEGLPKWTLFDYFYRASNDRNGNVLTNQLVQQLAQAADLNVLRTIIYLESGDTDSAENALKESLKNWVEGDDLFGYHGIDFPGRPLAVQLQNWLKELRKEDLHATDTETKK